MTRILLLLSACAVICVAQIPCKGALNIFFIFARLRRDCQVVGFLTTVSNQGFNGEVRASDPKDHWVSYCRISFYYDGLNLKANFQDCYFSDREYSNSRRNRLPFNPNAPDKHSYILTPNGRLITTLNSWGNHTYTHLLTCTASGIHYFGDHSGLIIFKKDCTR